MQSYLMPLVGGFLIGTAATLLLLLLGRIAGISGILYNGFTRNAEQLWRIAFIVGLPLGAWLFHSFFNQPFPENGGLWPLALVGGLLVGIGVKLGSGCTSGHGVCGIGRLSMRSIVATITFMATGIATVAAIGALI